MGRPIKFKTVHYSWDTVPIILTVKQVADILSCSTATVQNYIRTGRLKASKHGNKFFISKDALKEFMNVSFNAAAGGVCA